MTDEKEQWQSQPEAGSTAGLRFLMWIAQYLGRGVLRVILLPVAAYFCVVRKHEREASFRYLSRVFGRPARASEIYRHFQSFTQVTADRFYFLAGLADEIPVRFVVEERFDEILEEGRSGIILGAHFGSFEAARVLGPAIGNVRLRIVLDKSVNERFMQILATIEPKFDEMIIDSEQDAVALGLSIRDAIKRGDWVGMLADRHRTGDRTLEKSFLGSNAKFPIGPCIIASILKTPVFGIFCRLTDLGYEIHCEVLSEEFAVDRAQRSEAIDALVGKYVSRLEEHVRASPYAWFNFYDFWDEES